MIKENCWLSIYCYWNYLMHSVLSMIYHMKSIKVVIALGAVVEVENSKPISVSMMLDWRQFRTGGVLIVHATPDRSNFAITVSATCDVQLVVFLEDEPTRKDSWNDRRLKDSSRYLWSLVTPSMISALFYFRLTRRYVHVDSPKQCKTWWIVIISLNVHVLWYDL